MNLPRRSERPSMIRIGVDAWNLPGDQRGIGRYVRSVLGVWATSAADRVAVSLVIPERITWFAAKRYRDELNGRHHYESCSRSGLAAAKLDVLWFPFNGVSWNDTFRGPAVATLHDASTFVQPNYGDDARAPFRAAARRCAHLLTDSDFSAHELARELAVPLDRFTTVPLGVAPARPPAARPAVDPARYGRFVLYVGGTEPRKNIATVLAAMRRLTRHDAGLTLVLIGPMPFTLPPHDGLRIVALGRVDEATLTAFYSRCIAFIYPSTYEGFGLPILEAMSYGAPVIAARSSSLPEVGGDAALYVDPFDDLGFADAVIALLERPALTAELRARGRARAALMSWERTAHSTLAIIERVVEGARPLPVRLT
jgi:glycosyltransferase involved in cell wall biosynthesis